MPVQRATPDDLADLSALFSAYLLFYEVGKSPAQVSEFLGQRLSQGSSTLFIARDEQGKAQGFIQLYPLFDSLALRRYWVLNDLFVAEQARRKGIGEQLMEAARQHALASGASGLQLDTAKTNRTAQSLYERLGYVREADFYTYRLELS